jgi:DUF4097 and DUF4098 domain-containing protein YvlB
MRTFLKLLAVSAVFCVAPQAGAQTQDFQWRGRVTSGQTLEIKGINGDVRAVASLTGDAEVTAVKSARRSNPADVRIEVVPHAGGVTICAVYPSPDSEPNRCEPGATSRSRTQNNDTTVRFDVQVPAGVNFIGHTVNGSVEAESLNGDAEGYTVNGSVKLSTTGLAIAKTVNGSINATMGRADWTNGAKFSTVNGGITLHVPSYLSAELNASTLNGEIETDFPITVTGEVSRRRLRGTIGSGGQELNLSTVNGSIKLIKNQ